MTGLSWDLHSRVQGFKTLKYDTTILWYISTMKMAEETCHDSRNVT